VCFIAGIVQCVVLLTSNKITNFPNSALLCPTVLPPGTCVKTRLMDAADGGHGHGTHAGRGIVYPLAQQSSKIACCGGQGETMSEMNNEPDSRPMKAVLFKLFSRTFF
jgi:hypothetical protein